MYIAITNFFYWMTGRITYYHYCYHYVYTMDEKMMLNRNFNKNNNNAKDGEMEKLNLSITIMAMNTNLISKQNLMIIMQMSESWTFQPTRSGHLFPPFMFLYYTFTFHKHNYPNYYLEMLAVKCQFKMTWTCYCTSCVELLLPTRWLDELQCYLDKYTSSACILRERLVTKLEYQENDNHYSVQGSSF